MRFKSPSMRWAFAVLPAVVPRLTGLAVAVGDARINDITSIGARGELTTSEALSQLLRGTGYVARRDGGHFVLTPSAGTGSTETAARRRGLDFHQRDRPVQTPSRWQVRQRIYRSSIGRWRSYALHLPELAGAFP